MSAYRIASRAHARRAHKRRCISPKRIERARVWEEAIAWKAPQGKVRLACWRERISGLMKFPSPVQGDA